MLSLFKKLYAIYRIWIETRIIDKDIDAVFNRQKVSLNIDSFENENESQYTEALVQIKNKVKELSKGNLEDYLKNNPDISTLAEKDPNEVIEILRKITVASGQDVKDEDDKTKMINTRINHYRELQKYNEEKALVKQIRNAMLSGDKELHDNLMQQWRQKYGSNSKHQN